MSTTATRADNRTDAQLVAAYSAGDDDAFARLYERHHGRLVALLSRLSGDRFLAEDLAQDALVRALPHLEHIEGAQGSFWPWLQKVARNLYVDHARRSARAQVKEPLAGNLEPSPAMDPGHIIPERDLLRRMLDALPPRQKAAVLLCDAADLDLSTAASMLGVRRGALDMLLHRGRRRLAAEYRVQSGSTFPMGIWTLLPAWKSMRDRISRTVRPIAEGASGIALPAEAVGAAVLGFTLMFGGPEGMERAPAASLETGAPLSGPTLDTPPSARDQHLYDNAQPPEEVALGHHSPARPATEHRQMVLDVAPTRTPGPLRPQVSQRTGLDDSLQAENKVTLNGVPVISDQLVIECEGLSGSLACEAADALLGSFLDEPPPGE